MVFTITRFVPGGPIERMIAQAQQNRIGQTGVSTTSPSDDQRQPLSEDQILELKKYYGFDKPIIVSYFLWLGKVLRGDLGVSTRYYDPVWLIIRERIPISLYFGLLTMIIGYSVSIPLGISKALKHKCAYDNITSIILFIGYAIPGWVVGIMMLVLFASYWDIFPLGGMVSDDFDDLSRIGQLGDIIWHTLLPLCAYMVGLFTVMTFLMKNTLMENLSADYVRTAIAKGLSFKQAIFRHALRNSLIPIALPILMPII